MDDDSDFFARSAAEIAQRIDHEMHLAPRASGFSQQDKLALACRVLAGNGHARTLAGQAAELQLLARAAGEIRKVPENLAREAHDFLLKDTIVAATFNYWARRIARKYPEVLG